jgi:hypothetical protein
MASVADFEKLRVSLIQKIATADTPEKISALLAQMNNIPTTNAAAGGGEKDSADDMSESKINEVEEAVVPKEVLASREYLHSGGPHGMYKFQTSLTALGNGSNSSINNSDDSNNSNNNDNNISRNDFLSMNTNMPSNILDGLANVLFKNNETRLVKDILLEIIGNFNATRQNMCTATFVSFDRIDKKKDKNTASLASILTTFAPYNHPLVKSGTKTVNAVAQEFFNSFKNDPESNGAVTSEEWERYVMNQSFFIDDDASFELFLRRTWQMTGTFHLNKILITGQSSNMSTPEQRNKGRKLMTDKHGEIYGGTFSISSDSKSTPISPRGKKTFVKQHQDRNIGSHMHGAAAMSIEEISPSGRKFHHTHNVSQLEGMTPSQGSEIPRASRKLINVDKDTLSGSGVDPGELDLKIGLRKISKKNHFDGSSVGVASNHEGEVSERGLRRLPVSNESHFKNGHVADEDAEPARGLKRIVVANNMDNAGLSNAEAKVVRKRQNKTMQSQKPYYWDDKNSKKRGDDNDFRDSISGRKKGGMKKMTPGGNSQIIFG